MSRDLPYFKFNAARWLSGDITLEDYADQGVFINVVAYYWSKQCDVSLDNIKRKYKDAHASIDRLIDQGLIKVVRGNIVIDFLNEQAAEDIERSKINSQNGAKGGRPRGTNNQNKTEKKPTALFSETKSITEREPEMEAKKTNIDKEEDKEEDKNINNSLIMGEVLPIPAPNAWGNYESMMHLKTAVATHDNWINVLCIQNSIKKDQIVFWLDKFYLHAESTGENHLQEQNFKRHFANWLKKQNVSAEVAQAIDGNRSEPAVEETPTAKRNRMMREKQQQQQQ